MKGTLHPEARADASNEPFMVCALRAANGLFNYALGRAELHRETTWTYDVLSRMGVTAGAPVTVIASGAEAIPALIIENALTRLRAPWITIEDAPMDVAEFIRLASAPVTPAEVDEVRALSEWFLRRYPKGAERLAYARRAYARWTRG